MLLSRSELKALYHIFPLDSILLKQRFYIFIYFLLLIFVLIKVKVASVHCCVGGKSSVLLDVKPWDDETDMKKLEEAVRSNQMEGLLWGACMSIYFQYYLLPNPLFH